MPDETVTTICCCYCTRQVTDTESAFLDYDDRWVCETCFWAIIGIDE